MAGPLIGVKVLDLSRILAGPWASQVLADFGADVIKVEHPNGGDDTRRWGPPFLAGKCAEDSYEQGDAGYFFAANRGKRSICVDFTTSEGLAILHRLIERTDILIENYKCGGLNKYGLDYQSAREINPKIIYCSITGFGQTGPYAKRPGYDAIIQAMGGLMSVTGEKDNLPGGGPQKVGVAVADLMTGMYAVSGITAALYHREKTGQGQHIDLALFDTQVAFMANQNMNYLLSGDAPKREGSAHPNIVPYQTVKAKDAYFMLAVGNDSQFRRFCGVVDLPELASDSRFKTNEQRVGNREILLPIILNRLNQKTCQHWLTLLADAQVPAAPVNDLSQVFNDPQILAREMLLELPRDKQNQKDMIQQVANPVKFSQTKIEYQQAAPRLGADSQTILTELGFSEAEITSWLDGAKS